MVSVGGQADDGMRAQRWAKEREQGKEETDFMKKKIAAGLPFATNVSFVHTFNRTQGLPCLSKSTACSVKFYAFYRFQKL